MGWRSPRRPGRPAPTVIDGSRRYADQVVLITGATSGIDRASALAFAREGAAVAFCGRRAELGRQLADEITAAGGQAWFVPADVRDEDQVRQFVSRTVDRFGAIHVAMNNAGITIEKQLHEYSADEFADIVDTNLRGVFFAMKHQIPQLITQGGGTIMVTSSANVNITSARRSIYAASKSGLIGMVRSAALDYGRQGVRIFSLVPGTTDTPWSATPPAWQTSRTRPGPSRPRPGGGPTSAAWAGWRRRRRSPPSRLPSPHPS